MEALKGTGLAIGLLSVALAARCGEVARNGRAPVHAVIVSLEGASGAQPDKFGGTLSSDVLTIVERTINDETVGVPTIFEDIGRVTMRLILRDPGNPGVPSQPSALNQVTFDRYRVVYRRADRRNTPGVDVPFQFDSAATFTVPAESDATIGFLLVRTTAKQEPPLRNLAVNPVFVQTIAEVTFYGRDQAGNEVMATGNIGISFGNFADPK